MALKPGDKTNFATLERAWKAGAVAIVESRDLATGEYRALLCAMGQEREGDEVYTRPTPLAVMVWDNPYERFADPTADTLPPEKEPLTDQERKFLAAHDAVHTSIERAQALTFTPDEIATITDMASDWGREYALDADDDKDTKLTGKKLP